MRLIQAGTLVVLSAFLNSPPSLRAQAADVASAKVDFVKQIQPIFESSCYTCHGPKMQMAGLRLDEKSAALTGGQSGAVIVSGKSADSSLDRGAEWPDGATREVVQVQKHWAYIPPKRPAVPKVVNVNWPKNAIDKFLLA